MSDAWAQTGPAGGRQNVCAPTARAQGDADGWQPGRCSVRLVALQPIGEGLGRVWKEHRERDEADQLRANHGDSFLIGVLESYGTDDHAYIIIQETVLRFQRVPGPSVVKPRH